MAWNRDPGPRAVQASDCPPHTNPALSHTSFATPTPPPNPHTHTPKTQPHRRQPQCTATQACSPSSCASHPPPRAHSTSAASAPPSSTTSSRGSTAGAGSSASRTPTRYVRPRCPLTASDSPVADTRPRFCARRVLLCTAVDSRGARCCGGHTRDVGLGGAGVRLWCVARSFRRSKSLTARPRRAWQAWPARPLLPGAHRRRSWPPLNLGSSDAPRPVRAARPISLLRQEAPRRASLSLIYTHTRLLNDVGPSVGCTVYGFASQDTRTAASARPTTWRRRASASRAPA